MRKITCWYRVVNNERQMWGNVKWEKKYGYLIDGVVKESEG